MSSKERESASMQFIMASRGVESGYEASVSLLQSGPDDKSAEEALVALSGFREAAIELLEEAQDLVYYHTFKKQHICAAVHRDRNAVLAKIVELSELTMYLFDYDYETLEEDNGDLL